MDAWALDGIESNNDVYRGKGCMKKYWKSLREHAGKKIIFEKKIMNYILIKQTVPFPKDFRRPGY